MFKLNILLIFALFSYNTFAMNNTVDCKIKIDFEKSSDNLYSYTGYGEITCNDDNTPVTIFSAIKRNKGNSSIKNISHFSIETMAKNVNVFSYLFQTYEVINSRNLLFLYFQGDSTFPTRNLSASITGKARGTKTYNILANLLSDSDLIIEQDQFWEDEEI